MTLGRSNITSNKTNRESSKSKECSSSVGNCEMSQLFGFALDSDYKDFKDICVDSEIPSHQCPVQNCKLNLRNISSLLYFQEVETVGYGANAGTSSNKSFAEVNYKAIFKCGVDTSARSHNCNSPISNARGTREEDEGNSANSVQFRTEEMSSLEDGMSESSTSPSQSSTKFSAARRLAESDQALSCSSGSVSSSKRSFAFPILEREWDESPIRMVEADRRHLPKRQRCKWGTCFLCCNF